VAAPFPDDCTLSADSIEFDEDSFIHRYLSKNSSLGGKGRFMEGLGVVRSRMNGDRRLFIGGHDFVAALSWYLRNTVSKSSLIYRPEFLQHLLLAYIEPSRISAQPFFRELAARVAGSESAPAHKS
jgi:hypothetical protein